MSKSTMKIWATVHALTVGIQYLEVEHYGGDLVRVVNSPVWYLHGEGRQWHRTWESAVAKAEEMRKSRIKSLKKSLAKFEKLEFTKPKEISSDKNAGT